MQTFTDKKTCTIIGAPVQTGTNVRGCLMGPDALRTAGLSEALEDLGYRVLDQGNLTAETCAPLDHQNQNIRHLSETRGWIKAIGQSIEAATQTSDIVILLGGDHSVSAGSIPPQAKAAADQGRPLFVLWLDAHPDMHTLDTTVSGNLHGTPVAYVMGTDGFAPYFPALEHTVPADHICMFGLRSVDPAERELIAERGIETYDMRAIDEFGIVGPLSRFLKRVAEANGHLHVSLDVDFLDPTIASAVGTTVPGGATFRESHLIMEMIHDSGLMRSLDLVELNPALDDRGKTARMLVDLTASLLGRTILDRPTLS